MDDFKKTRRSGQLAAILFVLPATASQACVIDELPHCEAIDTRRIETAHQAVGAKVVFRVEGFTIEADPETLLMVLGRPDAPPSALIVAARMKEEVSVSTVTDASYVLHATADFFRATEGPNSHLDDSIRVAEEELLLALAHALEGESAAVSTTGPITEVRQMILTTYRCECGKGKLFTTFGGDVILKVSEPSKQIVTRSNSSGVSDQK